MFDEDSGLNLTYINSTTIEFEVESAYSGEILNCTWEPISFKSQELKLKFNFSDPLEISKYMNEIKRKDYLNMKVLDKDLFI